MAEKEIGDLTSGGAAASGDHIHAVRGVNSRDVILGGAAGLDVGTGAGTVAAGNDSRIVAAVPNSRTITAGTGLTGGGDLSANLTLNIDKASDAEIRSAASNKVVTADLIESASAAVALTAGSSIALDWDAGVNRTLTTNQNCTLANATNGQPGTWRSILVTNGASHTMAYGNQYVFPGGQAPVITPSSGLTRLNIFCRATNVFEVYPALDIKAP